MNDGARYCSLRDPISRPALTLGWRSRSCYSYSFRKGKPWHRQKRKAAMCTCSIVG